MTIQEEISTEYCSILINCSHLVLRLPHNKIKEDYSDNPMYVMEYIAKEVSESIIDILFDDQSATLSCTFDESNSCNASYIFLENLEELSSYISYLNKNYDYDYIQNRWVLPDSFLNIKKTNDDICFKSFY